VNGDQDSDNQDGKKKNENLIRIEGPYQQDADDNRHNQDTGPETDFKRRLLLPTRARLRKRVCKSCHLHSFYSSRSSRRAKIIELLQL
jgi:hypothetical protein